MEKWNARMWRCSHASICSIVCAEQHFFCACNECICCKQQATIKQSLEIQYQIVRADEVKCWMNTSYYSHICKNIRISIGCERRMAETKSVYLMVFKLNGAAEGGRSQFCGWRLWCDSLDVFYRNDWCGLARLLSGRNFSIIGFFMVCILEFVGSWNWTCQNYGIDWSLANEPNKMWQTGDNYNYCSGISLLASIIQMRYRKQRPLTGSDAICAAVKPEVALSARKLYRKWCHPFRTVHRKWRHLSGR